jgi:peptide deformylase
MTDQEQAEQAALEEDGLPPLVTLGDPRLATPSARVEPRLIAAPAFRERLELLARAMVAYGGIGIAAPQIGWFERFFVMVETSLTPEGEERETLLAWINPEIVSASSERNWAWEGCLSVPGLRGWVRRPAAVAVRGYDARGEPVSRELSGWTARVFQHEYDHLEGVLFAYRVLDPRHLVMTEQLADRDAWPAEWPAPGARDAPLGEVVADEAVHAHARRRRTRR